MWMELKLGMLVFLILLMLEMVFRSFLIGLVISFLMLIIELLLYGVLMNILGVIMFGKFILGITM